MIRSILLFYYFKFSGPVRRRALRALHRQRTRRAGVILWSFGKLYIRDPFAIPPAAAFKGVRTWHPFAWRLL